MQFFLCIFEGSYQQHHIPLIYVLCLNKAQKTYENIFRILLQLEPDIKPRHVIFDFEMAVINATKKWFPDAQQHGCNFHFCKNIFDHIKAVGLQTIYCKNVNFAHQFRMMMGLAFVHPDHVTEAYDQLVATDFWKEDHECALNDGKQTFLDYFERTYVGKIGRSALSQRNMPRFAIAIWNVHIITILGIPRTNNHVEGWHNRLNSFVKCHHPPIFTFLSDIMKEQCLQEIDIAHINSGEKLYRAKPKYSRFNLRMKLLLESYEDILAKTGRNFVSFLSSIADNLEM